MKPGPIRVGEPGAEEITWRMKSMRATLREQNDLVRVLRAALENVVRDLLEAHQVEMEGKHGGDDYCSYCEDIRDAKAALKAAGVKA